MTEVTNDGGSEHATDPLLCSIVLIGADPERVAATIEAIGDATDVEVVVVGSDRFAEDPRIRFLPADDASTWVSLAAAALDTVGSRFVVFPSAHGVIDADATDRLREQLSDEPALDVLYVDEDFPLESGGVRLVKKPGPAPEWLRCEDYWGDAVFYRTALLRSIGGFVGDWQRSARYGVALRLTAAEAVIRHDARILFHSDEPVRLGAIPERELDVVRESLEAHLAQTGGGRVLSVSADGVHDTRRPLDRSPLVSIVIPTRGQFTPGRTGHSYLVDAVESIVEHTTYEHYEIVVVVDTVADEPVLERIRFLAGERLVEVPWDEPFNFSGKINRGVLNALGEYALILNDDVQVITPTWIDAMLALAERPGVGMVGCMLYFGDDTIQHAGHHLWRGEATHVGLWEPRGSRGPLGGYLVEREVGGVTAACALVPVEAYKRVGGMTRLLPGAFNDVDLCQKMLQAGYEILWTPHAELYHFESKTRDAKVMRYEATTHRDRWGHKLHQPEFWPYPSFNDRDEFL
jgi:GT2 family glycosyltransferase